MAVESVTKEKSSSLQEFESLLNDDFKDRKLKENEVIKAVVTEITKNLPEQAAKSWINKNPSPRDYVL